MGNTVQQRNFLYYLRADKPSQPLNSSFVGGAPLTLSVGTPALLPTALNVSSDRVVNCSGHFAGPTSARPTLADFDFTGPSLAGTIYLDTTISQVVIHDGQNWRNVFTGATA